MKIRFFGTYDEARHPRIASLREGMELQGFAVDTLNDPLKDTTADRVTAAGNAGEALRWFVRLLRHWRALRRVARTSGILPDVVIVGYLGVLDVHLAKRLFTGTTIVLDHLAPLAEIGRDRGLGRVQRCVMNLLDQVAVGAADLVIVDTEEHAAELRERFRMKVIVVPVAAPTSWFSSSMFRGADRLKVIFFGQYTPLQGTLIIGQAIGRLAGAPIDFTMVGRGQDYEACRHAAGRNGHVRWIDWVEPRFLPDLVASHDVCLGVFGTGPKTQAVVPNKIVQGAAAGCAVVTGDSPPVRRQFGDAAVLIPVGDSSALEQSLRDLVDDRAKVLEYQHRARALADGALHPLTVVMPLAMRLRRMGVQRSSP
ncbi:MAG TPA: glycosyltransferase [Actinobacteria bacterium]|nr:putative glycosyl transferase [bacterium BMS3Bbin01]HDH27296.1 glycosyltransferase [Actinomycetota bacterium]